MTTTDQLPVIDAPRLPAHWCVKERLGEGDVAGWYECHFRGTKVRGVRWWTGQRLVDHPPDEIELSQETYTNFRGPLLPQG